MKYLQRSDRICFCPAAGNSKDEKIAVARNVTEILNSVPPRPLEFVNHLRL
jgi:hypothetical protein